MAMGRRMRRQGWRAAAIAMGIVGLAGALAGCGASASAGRHPPARKAAGTAALYATDGVPVNLPALEQKYGKIFPGMILRAPGAPKVPPFSLASYPPNHALYWRHADGAINDAPPASLVNAAGSLHAVTAELTAAQVAADWMIATNDNHPLTALQFIDPRALLGSYWTHLGVMTLEESQYHGIGTEFRQASRLVPGTRTPGGGYEYRTWALVTQVLPITDANSQQDLGKGVTLPRLQGYLPPSQRATAAYLVTVESYNVGAGSGGYSYGTNGPTPVLMADIQGMGWRVVTAGASPWTTLKMFPQHYAVPKTL